MIALALLAVLAQFPPPQALVGVDHDHLTVGDEVGVTLRITSLSTDPVQVIVPSLTGLELVARSERTELAPGGGPARLTTVELRLRGSRPGSWRVGPFEVRQGLHVVQVDPVTLTVAPAAGAVATTLNARVQRILERAPAPAAGGRVALTLIRSSDTVLVGEQVDVLTAAWFPRDLRLQLRRPPTLEAPQIDGVWSYPQPAPSGIAASRNIAGVWYDVFVVHQVIFPLAPGVVTIAPAVLRYSVPLAVQFFSQEERYTLTSASTAIAVLPLPDEGRPLLFSGAVGRQLTLRRSVTPGSGRVGEPLTVELTVQGEGNVALWPAPVFRWPPAVRTYSDRVDEQVSSLQGRLVGSKSFRYLLVPDSAGTLLLPSIRYSYFDPATRSYSTAEVAAASIGVARGLTATAPKALPPPLLYRQSPALAWSIAHDLPPELLLLLAALAPGVWLGAWVVRRRGPSRAAPPPPDDLVAVHRELDRLLERMALPPGTGGAALRHALQLAGVPPALAQETVACQERLQSARFAPGKSGRRAEVVRSARSLMARLNEWCGAVRGPAGRAAALALALLMALPLRGQAPAPEQLYEAGALEEAAARFQARTREAPAVAANWYNLGAARFRQGREGDALAAWTMAHRLAPRERHITQALRLVPPADGESAARLWTAPVTPEELGLTAMLAWLLGWAGLIAHRGPRGRWMVVLSAAVLLAATGAGLVWWYARPLGIVDGETKLLGGPYGRAPVVAALGPGSVLLLERQRAAWWLAQDAEGRSGWIPGMAVVRVGTGAEGNSD